MIIADTGFFVALASEQDAMHSAAMGVLNTLREPLITTFPVITETCYLLLSRSSHAVQCGFLEDAANGAFEIFYLQRHHPARMLTLMQRYANLPMDLADASLVVLAEHLGHGRILTVDRRDFSIYRWQDGMGLRICWMGHRGDRVCKGDSRIAPIYFLSLHLSTGCQHPRTHPKDPQQSFRVGVVVFAHSFH
jgi:predicted nucleic acid-binding protein